MLIVCHKEGSEGLAVAAEMVLVRALQAERTRITKRVSLTAQACFMVTQIVQSRVDSAEITVFQFLLK